MEHKDIRKVFTETMIKKAFIELLKTKNISKITVNDLCQMSSVNRSTFYRYYLDVYDLCEKIENDCLNELIEKAGQIDNVGIDKFFDQTLLIIKENPVFGLIQNVEQSKLIRRIIDHYREELLRVWKNQHPEIPQNELDYMFECLTGGITFVINKWVKSGMKETFDEIRSVMRRMGFFGVFG